MEPFKADVGVGSHGIHAGCATQSRSRVEVRRRQPPEMAVESTVEGAATLVKRRSPSANRPPPQDNRNLLIAASGRRKQADRSVYLPGAEFCSMLTVLKDGAWWGVGTIGREGMVGCYRAATDLLNAVTERARRP